MAVGLLVKCSISEHWQPFKSEINCNVAFSTQTHLVLLTYFLGKPVKPF